MPAHRFKLELAGQTVYGIAFQTETELEQFCAGRALQVAPLSAPDASTDSGLTPAEPPGDEDRPRGRPSRNEEIAAAIDALGDELDCCGSIKAQARAVRSYLDHDSDGEPPPGLSTIDTYISVYRRPRTPSASKIAQKISQR